MARSGYMETCWAVDAGIADDCNRDALFMLGWVPVYKDDPENMLSPVYDPQITAALMAKPEESGIGFDWAVSCEVHLPDFRNKIMSYNPPGVTQDVVFVGRLEFVDFRTREQVIPEHRELLDYITGLTETGPVVVPAPPEAQATLTVTMRDHEAPYGYRADGVTPKKKPGRKAAATNQ